MGDSIYPKNFVPTPKQKVVEEPKTEHETEPEKPKPKSKTKKE